MLVSLKALLIYIWCSGEVEAVAKRCSVKKVFLEISQNSQEVGGLQLYLKRDSATGVFL